MFLKILSLFVSSAFCSFVLTFFVAGWIKNAVHYINSWQYYNLLGVWLGLLPVSTILLFIALCIFAFLKGILQLLTAIPIGLLLIFINLLYTHYAQTGG